MGKPLTEEQRAFLAEYVTGLPRQIAKKTTSAYVDFLRRRGKVAAELDVASMLQEHGATSNVTFDLMLKNRAAFRAQFGRELGWGEAKTWSVEQGRVDDRLAEVITKSVRTSSPNRLADDQPSVTFDGTAYGAPQVLSDKGAQGTVTRYTAANGSAVVVKTGRKAMAIEMRAHRQAMGGEDGERHPNLVKMLGGATDAEGGLYMLLEECRGGDVSDFANTIREVVSAGVLPKPARTALIRGMFAQAAKGMKYVQDSGMTHNDIKGANYFMGADGTVMIADLGSGRKVNNDGATIPEREGEIIPRTLFFRAPEGAETTKSDVFSLRAMLGSLASDTAEDGKKAHFANDQRQTGRGFTAFDRLRNAMLEQDPAKRPTLEAVMLASFLDVIGPRDDEDEDEDDNEDDSEEDNEDDDDDEDYDEGEEGEDESDDVEDEDDEKPNIDPGEASRDLNQLDLANLQKAMTDYSVGPGREIGKLRSQMKQSQADIVDNNSKKDIWLKIDFFTQEQSIRI